MFLIRFVFYFALSFGILCIPIGNDRQLFDKLSSMVTPYARKAIKTTKQKFSSTKRYGRKLYSNSEPEVEEDQVKSKLASTLRKKSGKVIVKENRASDDTYTDEEQMRLRKALSDE